MASYDRQLEEDLRVALRALRAVRRNPGLPLQFAPTVEASIAANERILAQVLALKLAPADPPDVTVH